MLWLALFASAENLEAGRLAVVLLLFMACPTPPVAPCVMEFAIFVVIAALFAALLTALLAALRSAVEFLPVVL